MKFKIGDRVRISNMVKDLLEEVNIGEVGTIQTILEGNCDYPITVLMDKSDDYFDFEEEELELYKEKRIGKTFKEVIADIKPGETWDSGNRKIGMNDKGQIFIDGLSILKCFEPSVKYYIKRKEYTFEEAFKAYEEGKEIESCFSGQKFRVCSWEDIFNTKEIKDKWYINE